MDRYKISEWNDIIVVGRGVFATPPTVSLSRVVPGNPPVATSMVPANLTAVIVHVGISNKTAVWCMEQGNFSPPTTTFPQFYVWSMKLGGDMLASGSFLVEGISPVSHIPVYSVDSADKIICIGHGLPAVNAVLLSLYRVRALSPSSGGIQLDAIALSAPECALPVPDELRGTYLWSAIDDSASITNLYEPTMYAWVMTSDDPVRTAHGFFMVSESGEEVDYSGDFDIVLGKLNTIIGRLLRKKTRIDYPGKGKR